MEFIGKFGEYVALSRLLQHEIEAYPAIKVNQDSYDITAILASKKVLRIQVKARELGNDSTNNTLGKIRTPFDFLVIVVYKKAEGAACYVLTASEVAKLQGSAKELGISSRKGGIPAVRDELSPFLEKWDKIKAA